ncbi:MAG: hypothetical protein NTU98_05590 [Bacteroidetes bacterium]|nr:hypothetical protein [Bacteroidota bacterium]
MGLESNPREAIRTLRSTRFIVLTLAWGWVAGPALAWLITRIIPMQESQAAGFILASMAPTAPFYPLVVRRAHGDMDFAAALILLATVGTVAFMPIMVPLMNKGLTVNAWAIAKPLLIMVLLPLMTGLVLRLYNPSFADKLFPFIKQTGILFTLIIAVFIVALYGREMLSAMGSYAVGAEALFLIIMTIASYKIGFGLKQKQRSAMSLGMCTRNIAAVFGVYLAIPNPDPGLFVMLVLVVTLTGIISFVSAIIFARNAGIPAVVAE